METAWIVQQNTIIMPTCLHFHALYPLHIHCQLLLTALPVQGEESTLPFSCDGPHLAARDHPAGRKAQETTRQRLSHRAHPEAGLAPFMPAGSLCGLGRSTRGSGEGPLVTRQEIRPDKIDSTGPIIPPEIPQNGCLTGYVLQTQPQSLRSSPLDSTQSTHPCSYSTIYFLTRTTCRPVSWIPRHEISIWPPKADRHLQTTTAD
jgi:hypothetical protein